MSTNENGTAVNGAASDKLVNDQFQVIQQLTKRCNELERQNSRLRVAVDRHEDYLSERRTERALIEQRTSYPAVQALRREADDLAEANRLLRGKNESQAYTIEDYRARVRRLEAALEKFKAGEQ